MKQVLKIALIEIKDRRIRFVQSRGKDFLLFPGGKPEPGEGDLDTLERELREEMCVRLDRRSVEYLGTYSAPMIDQEGIVTIRCYRGTYEGEPSPGMEVEEIDLWLSSADGDKTTPAGVLVLKDFKERGLID